MRRLAIVVLWFSACGGGGSAAIPIDQLQARAMDALCSYEVRCGLAPDTAACDEGLYVREQLEADVKAGKVIYDGQTAAACLDVYRALSCAVSGAGLSSVTQAQSCKDIIKGTVATGGACLMDEECQSQACDRSACTTDTECCAGTCTAKIPAGGDCSAAGSRCADDLFCRRGTGTTGICTALIADGQPCTSSDYCEAGRRCNVVTGTSAGTCGVLPAHGQACPGMTCDLLSDLCDPASKTCVSRIAIGGDCSAIPTGCVPYANCDASTMKCVARKRAGEACAQSSDCLSGVACTAGICVPPPDKPACM